MNFFLLLLIIVVPIFQCRAFKNRYRVWQKEGLLECGWQGSNMGVTIYSFNLNISPKVSDGVLVWYCDVTELHAYDFVIKDSVIKQGLSLCRTLQSNRLLCPQDTVPFGAPMADSAALAAHS